MQNQVELLYLRRNPFLKLILPFLLGIIGFKYLGISIIISNSIVTASIILFTILFFKKEILKSYKFNYLFGAVLTLFLISFGYSYNHYYKELTKPHYTKLYHSDSIFEGVIDETPKEKNRSYVTTIAISKIYNGQQITKTYGKLKCYLPKDEKLPQLGDVLIFQTKLNEIPPPRLPNQFDYKNYLKEKGIVHSAFLNENKCLKTGDEISLFILAKRIRSVIIEELQKTKLMKNETAVLAALFLGEKQLLNQDIKSQFSDIGAMHVLAVSGLHVGILIFIISFILKKILGKDKNTALKVIITILLIWSFAFITGLSVSVLRASLMFSLIEIGRLYLRQIGIYNIIAVSAFILLLFNPQFLFDIGFQLSYLAVLGIIYFYPKINNLFYIKNKIGKYCWNITAVSIAAQIATIPLSIYYFHQIPLLALVSNIIVSVYAIIIIVGGLLLLTTFPVSFAFKALAIVLSYIIGSLLQIVDYLAKLPFSKIVGLTISEGELFGMILLILFLILIIETKRLRYINLAFGLITLLIIQKHFYDYEFYHQQKITFLNTENSIGINVTSKNQNSFITSQDKSDKINFMVSSLTNFWFNSTHEDPDFKNQINETKNHILEIGSIKILILNTNNLTIADDWFDYVLVNNNEINLNHVKNKIQTNKIILSNSFPFDSAKNSPIQIHQSPINSFHVQNNPSFDL